MISFDVRFDLDGLTENVAVMADKVQRKAALDLFGELIQTTPIDTGRARAGWNMDAQKGEDVPESVEQPEKWKKGKTPYYKRPKTPIPPKGATAIYIYNNVEYIKHLNDGTTTQAPRLFVEAAKDKVAKNLK
jgi:hypothetical protein